MKKICEIHSQRQNQALAEIIAEHKLWLLNRGGKQAKFFGSDLAGIDFQGANFIGEKPVMDGPTNKEMVKAILFAVILTGAIVGGFLFAYKF